MKYTLIIAIALAFMISPSFAGAVISVSGATVVEKEGLFDVSLSKAATSASTGQTRFDFVVTDIKPAPVISYWKIRVWCEKGVSIFLVGSEGNRCGQAVDITSFPKNSFSLSMDNRTGKTTGFSFKLKAYDLNGKWLHSEKESFRWK